MLKQVMDVNRFLFISFLLERQFCSIYRQTFRKRFVFFIKNI